MCLLLWRLCQSGRNKTRLPFLWLLELSSSFPTRALPTLGSANSMDSETAFLSNNSHNTWLGASSSAVTRGCFGLGMAGLCLLGCGGEQGVERGGRPVARGRPGRRVEGGGEARRLEGGP